MTKLAVVPINAALHARAGRHYEGDWLAILPAENSSLRSSKNWGQSMRRALLTD
jgi:hypothetical protein